MNKEETEEILFFRYQKIDDYTKDNLKNNVLYFNDPENFNDPFDSKIDIIFQGTKEDWSNYFSRYGSDPKKIDQWIREKKVKRKKNLYLLDPTKFNDEILGFFENSNFRLCCFSETKYNILMWSHYAENHQGICLCFRTYKKGSEYFLKLDSEPQFLVPVKYVKDKPKKVNMLYGEQYLELMDFFTKKYQDWIYEKEYRITIRNPEFEQGYTKKFEKEDLEGVIFGLNAEPDKIKEIYEIIDTYYLKHGVKVNFYRTYKKQGKYAIEVKKIDSIRKYLKN